MYQKLLAKAKTLNTQKHSKIIALAVVLAVVVIGLVVLFAWPKRSVAAFCQVHKQEDTKLAKTKGDAYAVAVFTHKSSNAHDFVSAFTKLERVAPDDIRPDVKILRQIFQTIDKDPAQAMSASLSGIGAESNVKEWTKDNCGASF